MIFRKHFFILALCASAPLFSAAYDMPFEKYPDTIVINNRILLKIGGNPITLMDVVKKMDLLFYRQYPELSANPMARYQFYSTSWRAILTSVIDDQLIMADAEEKKIEITDGEIREELETIFGPDVVLNLDKLGMTLEEAFDLLKTELTVQRMMAVMVRSKAWVEVHPLAVRQRYEAWLEQNPPLEYLAYKVLSIKGPQHSEVAKLVSEKLEKDSIEAICASIKEEGTEITLSDEYVRSEKEISNSHKAVLQTLAVGNFSVPDVQKESSRIFYLVNRELRSPTPFKDMEEKIKKEILDENVAKHNLVYREKLRHHYGLTEQFFKNEVPETLEPFALR